MRYIDIVKWIIATTKTTTEANIINTVQKPILGSTPTKAGIKCIFLLTQTSATCSLNAPGDMTIARRIAARKEWRGPELHALRRRLSKQLKDHTGRDVIQIALNLTRHDAHAYRFIAAALVFQHPGALERLTLEAVEQFSQGMDSWGDVDVFAGLIAGPAWRVGRLKDNHIHRWSRSRNRWWRRSAWR